MPQAVPEMPVRNPDAVRQGVRMSETEHAATESAVLVLVPAADPVVGPFRERYDRAASWGVPAHVTVLYPFVPPSELDNDVLQQLGDAVATVTAFEATFTRSDWFGEDVVWLAPEPAAAFRELTAAVSAAFPSHLPYGGAHDEVVPHLTVGEARFGGVEALRSAEQAVLPQLPLSQPVTKVALLTGTDAPQSWRVVATLPLG